MTFKSLSKAQQRELLRAYEAEWLEFGNRLLPTFWHLKECGYVDVKMSLSYVSKARVTPAGRELVERHQRDEAARAEHKGRKVLG